MDTNFGNVKLYFMDPRPRQDLENDALDRLATWASCKNIYFWVLPAKQIVKIIFKRKF